MYCWNWKSQRSCCLSLQNQLIEIRIESLWVFYSDARDLRRQWIMYPKNHPNISSQDDLYIRRSKGRWGVWKKVNQIRFTVGDFPSISLSTDQQFFICLTDIPSLEHNDPDAISITYRTPRAQRWVVSWPPGVTQVLYSSSCNNFPHA